MATLTAVDPDDLRLVLGELDRSGARAAATVAAADRLRSSIEPSLFDDPPLSDPGAALELPSHGRETEVSAAWRAYPKAGATRWRVLLAIASAGDDGVTDQQLEDLLNLPRPTPGNRRNELVRGGWVRDSGTRRPTRSGADAVVWTLTPTAVDRIAQEGHAP